MTTMAARLATPRFIMIRCECGRTLRARWEQAGGDIQCWDCRKSRRVIAPRLQVRVAGRMAHSCGVFLAGEGMGRFAIGAALVSLALLVPKVGLVLAGLLLLAGAMMYAETLRDEGEEGREVAPEPGRLRRSATPGRLLAGLGLVAGTVGPLWALGLGDRRSPHLGWAGLMILGLCWTIVPLALVASGRPGGDGEGAAGAGRSGSPRSPGRFPLLALVSLLIVPAGLLACELGLVGFFALVGGLPIMTFDSMPRQPGTAWNGGYVLIAEATLYNDLPAAQILGTYWDGLRQGYSFVGSIPPSLSLTTRWGVDPRSIGWSREYYMFLRGFATFLISLALIVSFALQARCFGELIRARRQFPGAGRRGRAEPPSRAAA